MLGRSNMRACVLWTMAVCFGIGEVTSSDDQIMGASELKKVSLSCPSFMINSSKSKYFLFFNGNLITEMHLNKETKSKEDLFSVQFEVTAAESGEYVCRRDILYPPPFRTSSTRIQVAEIKSPVNNTSANQSYPDRSPLIPEVALWAGCAALLIYSLSISCITTVIWMKLKRMQRDNEDTKVYANIRLGEHKKPSRV